MDSFLAELSCFINDLGMCASSDGGAPGRKCPVSSC